MRYEIEDAPFLSLDPAGRARPHHFGRRWRWTGSLSQRTRTARRLPQAVFKISSYSRSGPALWDRVAYVTRDGEVACEGPNGETFESLTELERLVVDWKMETGAHRRRVVAMNAVVSFPAGVDEVKAAAAARGFFQRAFAANHDYVFAPHTDAAQFHVHVVVQAAGHDGKQLRITRADLGALRMLLAETAREQGIELDASPRWARGLDAARRPTWAVEGLTRRGAVPTRARDTGLATPAARAALAEERARRGRDPDAAKSQVLEYARAAATLAAQLPRLPGDRRKVEAVRGAVSLASFSLALPHTGPDTPPAAAQAHDLIRRAHRVIHAQIRGIAGGAAKQEAIRANRKLARELAAHRPERGGPARQENAAPEQAPAREDESPAR